MLIIIINSWYNSTVHIKGMVTVHKEILKSSHSQSGINRCKQMSPTFSVSLHKKVKYSTSILPMLCVQSSITEKLYFVVVVCDRG